MQEFKYFILKLDETFFGKVMTFTKLKNAFNKLYNEFIEKQKISDEVYNLLIPLEEYFNQNFNLLNKRYKKEEKEEVLYNFLDRTETLIIFWSDTFDDFEILLKNLNPLHRKFKYLRKINYFISKN